MTTARNFQWKEVRNTFHLTNKKGNLFILFALGSVVSNYLREQGNYNQYMIKIALDRDSRVALENILSACPQRGQMSPLLENVLKIGAKYEKVFDSDERAKHNGPTPYPNISDASKLDNDTPLNSLPSFPALSLTESSVVAIAFTLASFTIRTGGISAKLEHVYITELAKDNSYLETPVKQRIISLADSSDDDDE